MKQEGEVDGRQYQEVDRRHKAAPIDTQHTESLANHHHVQANGEADVIADDSGDKTQ